MEFNESLANHPCDFLFAEHFDRVNRMDMGAGLEERAAW
jgi:hypothetical protein